jgi:hypothetical protein
MRSAVPPYACCGPVEPGGTAGRDGVGSAGRVYAAYGTKVAIIVFYCEIVTATLNRVREQKGVDVFNIQSNRDGAAEAMSSPLAACGGSGQFN